MSAAAPTALSLLSALRQRVRHSKFAQQDVIVYNSRGARGNEMQNVHSSTLFQPTVDAAHEAAQASGAAATEPADRIQFVAKFADDIVARLSRESHEMDRAIGAGVGLYIGDAAGAPVEFIDTDSSIPPYPGSRESGLSATLDKNGKLNYFGEYNKFQLQRGQWTDDASMSGCLADSLLVRGDYQGGDCRVRYFWWWFFGYNNAFRIDTTPYRRSVGLGGNIAKSIDEIYDFMGRKAAEVPSRYTSTGEDAGNGSMMRNAPVPIRFHENLQKALFVAEEQSFATHPGPDAAACCQFLTYFTIRAIKRPRDDETPMSTFLNGVIDAFKRDVIAPKPTDTGLQRLLQVLDSNPPSEKEASWKWRETILPTEAAVRARGRKYNGYPVDAGYFGAYSMDGLAMALWSMNRSSTFADTVVSVVNLLGDADTTGAIASQMAGAFYGLRHIEDSNPLSRVMLQNVRRWDPTREVELRSAMLYMDGMEESAAAAPAPAAQPATAEVPASTE